MYFCLHPGRPGGHECAVRTYRFYQLSCGVGAARAAGAAHSRGRRATSCSLYIELTLFIRFDLEQKVDKPSPRSASVNPTRSRNRGPVSLCLFLWNERDNEHGGSEDKQQRQSRRQQSLLHHRGSRTEPSRRHRNSKKVNKSR